MSRNQDIDFTEAKKRIFGQWRTHTKTLQIYRDACRRSHRILGAYLALWAWKKRVDCVALDRSHLLPYLKIERAMRKERLQWMAEDIKDFFPYQKPLVNTKSNTYHSLYLSRAVFPAGAFNDSLSTNDRVKRISKLGLRSSLWSRSLPSEVGMIIALATAATGAGKVKGNPRKKRAMARRLEEHTKTQQQGAADFSV